MIKIKQQVQDSISRLEDRELEAAKAENVQDNSQWGKSSFAIIESTKTPEKILAMSILTEVHLPPERPEFPDIPPKA